MRIAEEIPSIIELEEDEKIFYILHRSFLSFAFPYVAAILGITFSIVIGSIFYLFEFITEFSYILLYYAPFLLPMVIGVFSLILSLIIGIGLVIGYFYTRGHLYIVTNKRIILYITFISKNMREVKYSKITDTIFDQGPFGRIFNYSSIVLATPGMEGGSTARGLFTFFLSLKGIKDGLDVRQKILELIDITAV
ncbi:MAG: PH domain-containing protein [Candidatus Helarchaeales archaeon]